MNIHPLVVHFPIALLAIYSLLEIVAYFSWKLRQQPWLGGVKLFLLLVGSLSAFAALVTGGMAEDFAREASRYAAVIEIHAPVAGVTTLLYLILAAAYTVRIFDERGWSARIVGQSVFLRSILRFKQWAAHLILDTWLLPVLVLVALAGLMVTGALGTVIVYGPSADPFVSFIYHLLYP